HTRFSRDWSSDVCSSDLSRIGGIQLAQLAEESLRRHAQAFPERPANGHTLPVGGRYQYREGGEYHLFNPSTIHDLQQAVRDNDRSEERRVGKECRARWSA